MKRIYRIIPTLTALLLAAALAACGDSQTQSSSSQTSAFREEAEPESVASSLPQAAQPDEQEKTPRVLVAYFSATGNTRNVAQQLEAVLGAELYEILPQEPYTEANLDYNSEDCRANQEQNDPDARPAISGTPEDPGQYDQVFLGYPIWWGQAPKILYTFLESCDFGDAVIVPFCTSGSSSIGSGAEALQELAPDADWLPGQRFGGDASREKVAAWVESLGLDKLNPAE